MCIIFKDFHLKWLILFLFLVFIGDIALRKRSSFESMHDFLPVLDLVGMSMLIVSINTLEFLIGKFQVVIFSFLALYLVGS